MLCNSKPGCGSSTWFVMRSTIIKHQENVSHVIIKEVVLYLWSLTEEQREMHLQNRDKPHKPKVTFYVPQWSINGSDFHF